MEGLRFQVIVLDTNLGGYYEYMNKKAQGFTIVELLIVIVVIAILATISIAAYTNIQQRAKNTAIINAASQSLKMIEAYIAANGTYPAKSSACITVEVGCRHSPTSDGATSSNTTFNTNMATIGILPKSVPTEGSRLYGISYSYDSTKTFSGESRPAHLEYHLFGTYRRCGIPGVMRWTASGYKVSSEGYTDRDQNGSGKTLCRVTIAVPAHS